MNPSPSSKLLVHQDARGRFHVVAATEPLPQPEPVLLREACELRAAALRRQAMDAAAAGLLAAAQRVIAGLRPARIQRTLRT
jgi:hypothetical protein